MANDTPVNHNAILEAVQQIDAALPIPCGPMTEELFLLVSRLTPLVCVDLFVRDPERGTLLTWRHDDIYGPGWHIPGGVVRYGESILDRLHAVAQSELAAIVLAEDKPFGCYEEIYPSRRARGHHVVLAYRCVLQTPLDETQRFRPESPVPGAWEWHRTSPENIIDVHKHYAPLLDAPPATV